MRKLDKNILVATGLILVLALAPAAWAGGYTFVDIDSPLPGAATTLNDIRGLNNLGQIVGSYTLGGRQYSFIKNGDTYSTLDIPGTNHFAWGINDHGQVVGRVITDNSWLGYIYNTTTSSLTTIKVPGSYSTAVYGINNVGQICGYFNDGRQLSYMYDLNTEKWSYLNKDGATQTWAFGINGAGTIVGDGIISGHNYGYTYDGTFHDLNVPGAQNTRLVGINDHGDIVGRYWNDGGTINCFVYRNGNFETLDMPGAEIVRIFGINNAGQIVGLYTKDSGTTYHGFLGTPVNLPPVANAGLMQVVEVGRTATLDGSRSTDPEGGPLTYNWSGFLQPDGSNPVLDNPNTVSPLFTPDKVGHYVVQLIVTDSQGLSSPPATVTIWGVPKVWNTTGSMNQARQNPRFTTLADGRVLVVGGWTNLVTLPNPPYVTGSTHTVTTELFDPVSETWSFAGPMGYNSLNGSSLLNRLHSGKLLICGGQTYIPNGDGMVNAEVFDPATGLWTAVSPMRERRNGPKTFMLNNGKVLVTGGQQKRLVTNPDGSTTLRIFSLNSAEIYDPTTDTWTLTGPMTYGRASHLIFGLPDGRVLVTGGVGAVGENWVRQVLSTTEIYNPATGTWTSGPDLLPGRTGSGASILGLSDGRLMIIGGFGNGGVTLNDVQIYDPQPGAWSISGSLNQPRSNFTRNLMPDGKVLVWGGGDGLRALNSTEIWDPVSGTWSFTGNLNQASIIPVRAQLADGRVLSCCGTDGSQVLATTEIYGSAVTLVAIDIKPESSDNTINLGSNGKVPVAILSNPTFDAQRVDPATVTLAGAHVALKGKADKYMIAFQDVNGDGLLDLIVHVDTTALQLSAGDTRAVLEGKTYDGVCIRGTDTVRIVP
jgi:hypothetical protein